MTPRFGMKRRVERVVEPMANFGLNFVTRYERPRVEFSAPRIKDDPDEFHRAAKTLQNAGAIVLRSFHTPAQIDRLRERIEPFFEYVEQWRNVDPRFVQDRRFVVQNCVRKMIKGGWGSVVKYPKSVVNFRIDEDAGLVDLFHPELIFDSQSDIGVADATKEALINALLERAFGCGFATTVRNLYLNDSVLRTRGFHIDGLALKSKNFLYMTDVDSEDDGPYVYALGTHRGSKKLHAANKHYNSWFGHRWDDFPLHGSNRRVTFCGRRGDLIVSIQSGAHRGLPQARGRRRIVLVHTSTRLREEVQTRGERSA